jgi:glycosyltransferase involved in cell wall biosynthesis
MTLMSDPTISAFIITRNEADNLPECLQTLKFCQEIVVLDQQSDDDTAQLAKAFGARIITTKDWPGFGIQKQRALNLTTGEWVLSIDADERIPPELAAEIQQAIRSNTAEGYYIKRRSQFLGKWMRHGGWYPDRVLRLARRANARFDLTPIHEKMLIDGRIVELRYSMLHYSYRSIDDLLAKQKTYALAGAEKKSGARVSGGVVMALLRSGWTFVRLYGVQLGFLDGRHGLVAAIAKSQETFWKYLAAAWPGDRSQ